MNYKRAILAGLMIYAITFLLSLIAVALGIGFENRDDAISIGTWIFGGATSVASTAIGAYWYYRKKGTTANTYTGFHLGLVTIVVSFVLDWLAFLPVMNDPETFQLITSYYGNLAFWTIVVLILATATLMGRYYDRFSKARK